MTFERRLPIGRLRRLTNLEALSGMRMKRLRKSLLLLGAASVLHSACNEPLETEVDAPEIYWVTDVHHVLNENGRRVGELSADSLIVRDQGNEWIAWRVVVRLERGALEIRADSMTLDWRRHEMRYHGEVEIASEAHDVLAEDVIISDW